jgi:hypothetical protein
MPRKIKHSFQLELLHRQNDKARIERELKLRQRIYKFAELSDKERKRRFAFLIVEKRLAAERQYAAQLSESDELDSDSNLDDETDNEKSFPNPQENITKPFDSRELNLGIIIGILVGLCFGLVFSSQEHFHLFTLFKK